MVEINDLSTTDASNTDTGANEGWLPSQVNNSMRANLGLLARWVQHASGENLVAVTETGVNSLSVSLARSSLTNTASASGSTGYIDGLSLLVDIPSTITDVAVLGINGKIRHPILGADGITLSSSGILAGTKTLLSFDASAKAWQLLSAPGKIGSTQIADDSVTLAKMAAGTAGGMPIYDASGDPADAGAGTSGQVWTSAGAGAAADWAAASGAPKNYLTGCGLSNNATAFDLDIAAGVCRDNADAATITVSALTKQIDASWAAGTNAGGLSSSLTLTLSTWYHVFAIVVSGSADVGFDTDISAANLVSDHSATAFRRIGSVLMNAGNTDIIDFSQEGDEFLWLDPPLDENNNNPGTSAVTPALSVPLAIKTRALLNVSYLNADTTDGFLYVSSPDVNDEVSSATAAPLATISGDNNVITMMVPYEVRTDTSSQVRYHTNTSSANVTVRLVTRGWIDTRGK